MPAELFPKMFFGRNMQRTGIDALLEIRISPGNMDWFLRCFLLYAQAMQNGGYISEKHAENSSKYGLEGSIMAGIGGAEPNEKKEWYR